MRTLGILLAGGQGTRLGGDTPKALALCAGRTLLARALATLSSACDAAVVVAPAGLDLPVAPLLRVADPPDAAGPLAALVAGLTSPAGRACDEALVLAVDFPLLLPATLAALRALRGAAVAVLPAPGGIPQPLAAWYTPGALAPLAAALAAGERAPSRAVPALAPVIAGDPVLASLPGGLDAWLNVNTRADLAEAARRLEEAERRRPSGRPA
jgi:molybdopterin-guanine dinucleotide biosynthesis protein A